METEHEKKLEKIPVWIIDDNKNFCLVLAANLNKSTTVDCRRYYHSCRAAINDLAAESDLPGVILLDIKMPVMSGLDAIVPIKRLSHSTSIIMLTSYEADENIRTALKRGATGYLLKTSSSADIVRAIENAQVGGVPLDPLITKKMMEAFVGWEDDENRYNLSVREKEILKLVKQGYNNAEIAERLFISRYTVGTHVRNISCKLDVHDRPKLLAKAIKDRIV